MRGRIFLAFVGAAPFGDQVHDRTVEIGGSDDLDVHPRFADFSDQALVGEVCGRCHDPGGTFVHEHFISHRGGSENHVQVVFSLEPLLDDLHVEKAQEPGPEAEPQRLGSLRLESEGGIVELQFIQCLAQALVIIGFSRVDPGEDHRLGGAVTWQRGRSRAGAAGDRISNARIMNGLQPGGNVAHLSRRKLLHRFHGWSKDAHLDRFHVHSRRHQVDAFIGIQFAFHHAHVGDDALVRIVMRVENQGAQGSCLV